MGGHVILESNYLPYHYQFQLFFYRTALRSSFWEKNSSRVLPETRTRTEGFIHVVNSARFCRFLPTVLQNPAAA